MKFAILTMVVLFGLGGVAVAQMEGHDHARQAAATTQPAAKPVNTKCPIMGEPIDASVTIVHDGKTIAFCCKDCIPEFKKDPAKYMAKLK